MYCLNCESPYLLVMHSDLQRLPSSTVDILTLSIIDIGVASTVDLIISQAGQLYDLSSVNRAKRIALPVSTNSLLFFLSNSEQISPFLSSVILYIEFSKILEDCCDCCLVLAFD